MFFQLFSMLGLGNQGHKRAALAAREQFSADHPGEAIAWVEIAADEPACFMVGVHHGQKHPKRMPFLYRR